MSTTIGQWIDLPTSGGAADRFALDEPGGAGLFQIAASNATLAARENGLRVLWEDFGSSDVSADLFVHGVEDTFQWDGEDTDGVYARCCGVFRVRLYGETVQVPRITLAARALAPATYETGIILALSSPFEAPSMRGGTYATARTASTSIVDLTATLALSPADLVPELLSLQAGPPPVIEAGQHLVLGLWVGAWCTSNSGAAKGAVYGPSVLVREP